MSKGIFITGTGTDIGKTYVTGLIVKKLRESGADAAYYKAAMSGNERRADGSLIPGDALQVKTMSGIGQPLEEMCPYVYETAVSPHLASRLEGNPVQMDRVLEDFHKVCEKYEYVTMEGSGGILCPLCIDEADIRLPEVVKACGLGCLLIADAGLGTINGVALYSQMQQMMVDEAPALWLYQQDTLYAYNSKKVQNWTARTDEVVLMDGVSVAG